MLNAGRADMYEYDLETEKENREFFFKAVYGSIADRSMNWKCKGYIPISYSYITGTEAVEQIFYFTAKGKINSYDLSVLESISLFDGTVSIMVSLEYSGETNYECGDKIYFCGQERNSNSLTLLIADLPIGSTEITQKVNCEFEKHAAEPFYYGNNETLYENPVAVLCRRLRESREFYEFHKIVYDLKYRNELMSIGV